MHLLALLLSILFCGIRAVPFHHDLSEEQIAELMSFMPLWDGQSPLPFEKDRFENVSA
jgi:hypothetical protein